VPELRPYQIQDLAFHIAHPKSLNESDPGTGKTPTACVLFYYWWARKQARTVWAMPLSLMEKNREELLRFTDFAPEDVVIMESDFDTLTKSWEGATFTRQKEIDTARCWVIDQPGKPTTVYELQKANPGVAIIEVSQEGYREFGKRTKVDGKMQLLPWAANPPEGIQVRIISGPDGKPLKEKIFEPELAKDLIKTPQIKVGRKLVPVTDPKVFICTFAFLRNNWERLLETWPDIKMYGIDELHMGYSTPSSEQTASFYQVNDHCDGLLAMTGTLIDGRLDSAFPVIHAIEPRYYGGLPGFIHEHAAWINDYGKVESWKNEEKLRAILKLHSVKHSFEEVYGKEPVHFETVLLEMFEEQRAAYDEFHEQAMLELEDGRILDGSLPGVAVIRATQIMAHPETMLLARGEITAKDKKLMEYAVEGRPMLVFSSAVAEQERCVARLESCGLRAALINNSVSMKARGVIDRDFRAGKLDAIVGSGPTVAVGYNWERADHVVNVSLDYKDVNFVQAYRRASRGTRTSVLRVTTLAYEDSIDLRKMDILTSKSELANRVDETRRVLRF
jgi:hypothetical protein